MKSPNRYRWPADNQSLVGVYYFFYFDMQNETEVLTAEGSSQASPQQPEAEGNWETVSPWFLFLYKFIKIKYV